VVIEGTSATGNRVVGNYIGTDASGSKALGNETSGVSIVHATTNTVGGTMDGERIIIGFNREAGIAIIGDSATANRVLSNSIFSTRGLGVDLGANGPTANDPGDPDPGPNGLQNKSVLSSASTSATSTAVRGKLKSIPNKTFLVQFFSNPSGNEGKK